MRKTFLFLSLIFLLLFSFSSYAVLPQQVMIEVKVVEINYDAAVSSGISWGLKSNNDLLQTINSITANFPRMDTSAGGISITFGALSTWSFEYGNIQGTLQALEKKGKADLLSSPRIVTLDGVEAKILTGEEEPVPVVKIVGSTELVTTEYKKIGVELVVTPTIQEQDFVLLNVKPKVSSRTGTRLMPVGGSQAELPVFSTREAATQVLVKDGETFMLGGLYKTLSTNDRAGIPVLSHIPFFGPILFGSRNIQNTKTEIVIFITPHIIRPHERMLIPPNLMPPTPPAVEPLPPSG
ncbi:MAG: type II and III secretion system protein [bacterium]|nr:type II and III secretion system protein [bacterium]